MSGLRLFFKENKKQKEHVFYAATKSLCDEDGKPLQWELKPLTTAENDEIREYCTHEVQVPGKANMYRQKTDTTLYVAMMLAESVVYPNLHDEDLLDSYEVETPQELIREMIDDPGEYNDFASFVQGLNGFTSFDDKVEEAKN